MLRLRLRVALDDMLKVLPAGECTCCNAGMSDDVPGSRLETSTEVGQVGLVTDLATLAGVALSRDIGCTAISASAGNA